MNPICCCSLRFDELCPFHGSLAIAQKQAQDASEAPGQGKGPEERLREAYELVERLTLQCRELRASRDELGAALDELLAVHELDEHREIPQMPCSTPLSRRAIWQAKAALAKARSNEPAPGESKAP